MRSGVDGLGGGVGAVLSSGERQRAADRTAPNALCSALVAGVAEAQNRGSAGPLLGTYGGNRATLDSKGLFQAAACDQETGEIPPQPGVFDAVSARLERFALQSVSRRIVPEFAIRHCFRTPQKGRAGRSSGVEVRVSTVSQRAFYAGLQTCGLLWVCPICGAKISERRRLELQAAIHAWKAKGGAVALLTLTCPHNRGDALAGLLDRQAKALHAFFRNRQGRGLLQAMGVAGHVRAWEVTHGWLREDDNGWHPHFHILLFIEHPQFGGVGQFKFDAYVIWAKACEQAGLERPSERHGVTLEDGDKAARYVAKMGLEDPAEGLAVFERGGSRSMHPGQGAVQSEGQGRWTLGHEMTKGHSKRARNSDGGTPFDMLRAQLLPGGDSRARALFREFAFAFKGRKQLQWSRGLRELLGLGQAPSDEEVAHETDAESVFLSMLTPEQWAAVKRLNLRGELLEIASLGADSFFRFLSTLDAR